MIEERSPSRQEAFARQGLEARRSLLVHPQYLRDSSSALDSPRTTEDDLMWVIAYHKEQIELAQAELIKRWMEAHD